jgi:Restriction endonuclease EcoRV
MNDDMKNLDIKTILEEEINKIGLGWDIKGVIDSQKRIYTINDDTKLISKVFELVVTPLVLEIGKKYNLKIVISDKQTFYPDFTLILSDDTKYALDVKSTYRRNGSQVAGFTLGSYTGYLRNPTKNIMFPYNEYIQHWILGFIYTRETNANDNIVTIDKIDSITPAIKDIEIIVQEKYKIASDRPGSGNTANIGSSLDIEVLKNGTGVFSKLGEREFEKYWRGFTTRRDSAIARKQQPYRNIAEYIEWSKNH